MNTIFVGKYLAAGTSDLTRLIILQEPDGSDKDKFELLELTEKQQKILDIITSIDEVSDILILFASAGARLGFRLGRKPLEVPDIQD